MSDLKKVIILTLPLENNYGGLLQAYALQKVITDMGFEVVTDKSACKNISWKNRLLRFFLPLLYKVYRMQGKKIVTQKIRNYRYQRLNQFISDNIMTVDFFKGRKHPSRKDIKHYDIFVVGSDQVWRKKYVRVKTYFLDFLRYNQDKIRISYAASFGLDNLNEWSLKDKDTCGKLALRFNALSVREREGITIMQKAFGVEPKLVVDPTLLLERKDYLNIKGIDGVSKKASLLFCYVLDLTEEKKELIDILKKEKGLDNVLFISPKMEKIDKNLPDDYVYPSMNEWLAAFRDAEFVFTDSFHGTVFSIIFNKQFLCYANKSRGISRLESLFNSLGIEGRMIVNSQEYKCTECNPIDYSLVIKKIESLRRDSLNFLNQSLQGNGKKN